MILGGGEILRDPVRFDDIAADEGRLQFHDIIILGDTDIALHECSIDGVDTFGTTVDEFVDRPDDCREIGTDMIGQDRYYTRVDRQFGMFFFDVRYIRRDPFLHFKIPQFIRLKPNDLRMIHDMLPDILPFVGFAVIADDEDILRHHVIKVGIEGLPFLDGLCLANDNDLTSAHHGIAAHGGDDRRDVRTGQITTIKYLLVKLTRHLIQRVGCNELIHAIGVVRFFAAQDVYRCVGTGLEVGEDIIELLDHRCKSCIYIWSDRSLGNRIRAAYVRSGCLGLCIRVWS